MEVFRWPGGRAPEFAQTVATLGVFDGVHVGHQEILRQLAGEAAARSCPSVVITFDRHPNQVLEGPPQPCITSREHRVRLFEQLGLDACLMIHFTEEVAGLPAPDFARTVLRDLLHVKLLIGGPDSRFGRGGEGDVEMLRAMHDELALEARVVPPVEVEGSVVSSTAIRRAVQKADLERARKLLGRPFSLLGTVVEGAGLGHDLGFPTANLDVHHELMPREGVYASRVRVRDRTWDSATSVGSRETFDELRDAPPVVEVHVIGEEMELYGRDVEVEFVAWIRAQERFGSAEELRKQIAADVQEARRILARRAAQQ